MSPQLQEQLSQYGIGSGNSPVQDTINSYATPKETQPANVKTAMSDVGDQSYNRYCQAFVEQTTYGKQGIYPTAKDAWNTYLQNGQGKQGTDGIKPGDLLYFEPTAQEPDAHVGIFQGGNNFVSAQDYGVKSQDIGEWQKETGQQIAGYVPIGR